MEGRLVMEPVMARLAAERQDAASLAELKEFLTTQPQDDASYMASATGFHAVLSGMSGNPVLDLMGRSLKDIYTDRIESLIFPPSARGQVQDDHAAIAKAITSGNANRAEKLMRVHMEAFVKQAEERSPGVLDEIVDWH
jgi:DNA-binding FadR family transcriptional regulator